MSGTTSHALDGQAIFYLCLLALQFGIQPSLTTTFISDKICGSTVILMQEMLKCIFAYSMLTMSGNSKTAWVDWNIPTWIAVAFVPAALYALQNVAALHAYQNLDALTFNVLNQTKTLSAALCCYLIMGKKESTIQIFSLFLLLLAALIMEKMVTLDTLLGSSSSIEIPGWGSRHWTHGVAPILLASFISGLSGALAQKNLQLRDGGRNPYLFSMELSAASALILSFSLLISPDGQQIAEKGFWDGWTAATWIPIAINAVGGIIVGLVTKYAGSVRKGFALIFGILLSGIVQAYIQAEVGVSKEEVMGGIVAAISLWLHATNPPTLNATLGHLGFRCDMIRPIKSNADRDLIAQQEENSIDHSNDVENNKRIRYVNRDRKSEPVTLHDMSAPSSGIALRARMLVV